ncbi:unnamed protein product [Pleuronectes platessa]|uniref:Uncharacterized protein n=1 Tax=Pleuronectes platessa TaxID=8262 RepID=A0A9N7V7C2_PLEPL|nr:unnamed protein product [Pleuronectes platessa]
MALDESSVPGEEEEEEEGTGGKNVKAASSSPLSDLRTVGRSRLAVPCLGSGFLHCELRVIINPLGLSSRPLLIWERWGQRSRQGNTVMKKDSEAVVVMVAAAHSGTRVLHCEGRSIQSCIQAAQVAALLRGCC